MKRKRIETREEQNLSTACELKRGNKGARSTIRTACDVAKEWMDWWMSWWLDWWMSCGVGPPPPRASEPHRESSDRRTRTARPD